jgi:hypothetical protein
MYLDNFPPSFAYNNHRVIFNYAVLDILVEVLRSNKDKLIEFSGVKHLKFNEDSYIVYIDQNTKEDIFERKNHPNVNNYHMSVGWALKNSGVFTMLDGCNALELAEDLAKHSGLSVDYIMETYKKNVITMSDETKDNAAKSVSSIVPKLYELAKSTNQIKIYGDDGWLIDDNLKSYCDSDFYIYTYNDIFFIACYASANMYVVNFKDDGFVIYGHSNSYGKEIEQATNPEFEWDTAEFEPYYLKYLNDNMIIMEVKNNVITVQNSLVDMLRSIVEFIAEEEKIN